MHECHWSDHGTFLICVDSYRGSIPRGHLYHPVTLESVAFSGLMPMLLALEQIMNLEDLPQGFQQIRSFGPGRTAPDTAVSTPHRASGQLGTFLVQIRFRRNAGWQGIAHWQEGRKTQHFRSVLELLLLMDSALSSKEDTGSFVPDAI